MESRIMTNFIPACGRLKDTDHRDALFPVGAVLPDPNPFITEKYWWDDGWWGNQGSSECCVAFSSTHWFEDGPLREDAIPGRPTPIWDPHVFYDQCQLRDPWAGTPHNGTSIRTAMRLLKALGMIQEYRWANSIDDIVQTLINLGPMVVATEWLNDMINPDPNGIIHATGNSIGGHAYVLNGVDINKKLFRIKNSWGQEWGVRGHAFIGFDEYQKLFENGGEATIMFKNKITTMPDFSLLPPPGATNDGA